MIGGQLISENTGILEIVCKALLCSIIDDPEKDYPSKLDIQVRQSEYTLVKPEYELATGCTTVDKTEFWFDGQGLEQPSTTPPAGMELQADQSIKINTTKEMAGQVRIIRYSLTMYNSATPTEKVNKQSTVTVTYHDRCELATLSAYAVQPMTTSVLRPASQAPYDLEQIFTGTPTVALNPANSYQNQAMCGEIETRIEPKTSADAITSEFITSKFEGTQQWVKLAPTKREHVGTYTLSLEHKLKEYTTVTSKVDLPVTVLDCEILKIRDISDDPYLSMYTYTLMQDTQLTIISKKYEFYPACLYSDSMTLAFSPAIDVSLGQSPFYTLVGTTMTLETTNLENAGEYTFTLHGSILDYPLSYVKPEVTKTFKIKIANPCEQTTLQEAAMPKAFHAVIGKGLRTQTVKQYQDDVSLRYDPPGDPDRGYKFCGKRYYTINRKVLQTWKGFGKQTQKIIPTISTDRVKQEVTFTYGSNDDSLVGTHELRIKATLLNYTTIANKVNEFTMTFYKQEADLSIADQEYTVSEGIKLVSLPKLRFTPALHQSQNAQTGENGVVIRTGAFLVTGSTASPMPIDLGSLTGSNDLEIDCTKDKYAGAQKVRIVYYLQDYLSGVTYETDFSIVVSPQPVDVDLFMIKVKPTFKLDDFALSYTVKVGKSWSLTLPETQHEDDLEVAYSTVNLDKAAQFMSYDEGSSQLIIAAGATTESSTGTYDIKLQLVDSKGVLSDTLKVTVKIAGENQGTSGSDSDSSGDSGSGSNSTASPEEISRQVGAMFAKLLRNRVIRNEKRDQLGSQIELTPPKAKISSIDQLGNVQVTFSKPMVTIPELFNMTQDGIYVSEQTDLRNLDASSGSSGVTQPYIERLQLDIFHLNVEPGSWSDPRDMKHSWNITKFTSDEMHLKINFEKPLSVSGSLERDTLELTFLSDQVFIDQEDGLPLRKGTTLTRKLPAQLEGESMKQSIETATQALQGSTSALFAGNIILTLPLSFSLQYLWEMINAQQIVVLLPLLKVQIPQNANMFFQALMTIAAFEIIPTETLYSYMTDQEGEPLSETFEELGFEHHLILNNYGTLGFFFACLPFIYAFNGLFTPYRKNYCDCLKNCLKRISRKLYWNMLLRLIIEGFLMGLICCLLNLRVIDLSFEADRWTRANAIVTLIIFPLMILFPVFGVCFVRHKFHELRDSKLQLKFGEMFEGYATTSRTMVIYWALDFLRKALLCLVLTFGRQQLWLQMMCFIMTSIMMVIAANHTQARNSEFDRRMDIFNDAKLIVLMYHMILFTEFVSDHKIKLYIGYSCVATLILSVSINMLMMIVEPVLATRRNLKLKYAEKQREKEKQRRKAQLQIASKGFQRRRIIKFLRHQKRIEELNRIAIEKKNADKQAQAERESELIQIREELVEQNLMLDSFFGDQAAAQEQPKATNAAQNELIPLSNHLNIVEEAKEKIVSSGENRYSMPGHYYMASIREESPAIQDMRAPNPLYDANGLEIYPDGDQPHARKPQRLTVEDLSYLYKEHGIGPDQVMNIPGFEDFELVDDFDDVDEEQDDQLGQFDQLQQQRQAQVSTFDLYDVPYEPRPEYVNQHFDHRESHAQFNSNAALIVSNLPVHSSGNDAYSLQSIIGYEQPRNIGSQNKVMHLGNFANMDGSQAMRDQFFDQCERQVRRQRFYIEEPQAPNDDRSDYNHDL